jgi:NTE family protein
MKFDLVFEGGGAKGMVFVGAYGEFVQRGHSFGRLLGTSAGAITAVLLAAGYSTEELQESLNEKENGKSVFAGFMGPPPPFTQADIRASAIRELLRNINIKFVPDAIENRVEDAIAESLAENERFRHLFAFVERGGWYAADRFVSWLETKLNSGPWKGGKRKFSRMTLTQFFAETAVHFSVVASDTTAGRLLVLNHLTSPDCPVVWAVRMSMSIPLVWDEVIWDKSWGAYLERDMSGHAIVDGGLLSNFPIELLISDEPQVTRLMGPKGTNPVLGLLIDESLPVIATRGKRGLLVDVNVKPGELRTVQRLIRLANIVTTAHDKMVIEEFEHLVVRLPAQGYGTTEFDMSDARRSALVEAGRRAMAAHFDAGSAKRGSAKSLKADPTKRTGRDADRIALRLLR